MYPISDIMKENPKGHIMSFETLKKEDLLKIAEEFGSDVKPSDTKAVIIATLNEDGVTWEQAAQLDKQVAEKDAELREERKAAQAEAKAQEEQALLRMMRENHTFEVRGYRFTKSHPFSVVSASDAEWIVDNVEGIRYATPREAQEFYG
jgi:tRNA(Ser,Leu) C12 N-acetylase TAN1